MAINDRGTDWLVAKPPAVGLGLHEDAETLVACGSPKPLDKEAHHMNWDVFKGNWRQVKGKAREEWGEITDNEWDQIAGNYDQFVGRLQERYGWDRDEANRRAEAWADKFRSDFERHAK